MINKMIKKCAYIGVFILFITAVISCEKDFQDIASSVVSNTKFDTKDTILEVVVTNKAVTSVRADGLTVGGTLGQYLLGVYNNPNYEKIEASMVSQLALDNAIHTKDSKERVYGADTTVVTTIDTVFLKLPYQATLKVDTTSDYVLDSIIGDQTKAFNLNLYRTETFMSRLNPVDPSKASNYQSNAVYQVLPGELNDEVNYQFKPNAKDTVLVFKRRLSNGNVYATDTVKLTANNPFARVPLNEDKIKQIFVDQFDSSDFETQQALNTYFKGLYIEASGNEGSLTAFNIATTNFVLKPSVEIRYTKTVVKNGTTVVDTIAKEASFLLSNFSTSLYKMDEKIYPTDKNVIVQGTAGNMAQIKIFGTDTNNNNIDDQLEVLRAKNWLVNDASLTFYVNQDIVGTDTIATPYKLFLYKDGASKAQIKDHLSEGATVFGGNLVLDSERKPDHYTFRITDYISDLMNGSSVNNPILGLKVVNPTDVPSTAIDTLVTNYSWNPKAVTLLNHFTTNGARRAQLKISYSIKK